MKHCLALFLAFFLAFPAQAVVVSRITDFEAGTPVVADDLDAELDNILDAINGNISGENIASGAIATGDLASYSVTKVKLGPFGHQVSSSSALAETSSLDIADVTNLSANITVSHRPVWVGLQPADSAYAAGSVTYRNNGGSATGNRAYISFQRDGATRNQSGLTVRNITNPTNDVFISIPCSSFWFLDDPGGGTYAYKAVFRKATGDDGVVQVENCKLVVFEL